MRIPVLKFQLPEWRPADFAPLERNKKKIAYLLSKTGKGSDKFLASCDRIKTLAVKGRADLIPGIIKTSVDVRALTYLLGEPEFRARVRVTKKMLDSLYTPKPMLGLISLFQLINVFFRYFDQIAGEQEFDKGLFDHFCRLLRKELANQGRIKTGQEIADLSNNKDLLFALEGPQRVVDYAMKYRVDLDVAFKELALQNYHDTRFHRLCRYRYYLDTLRQLPVGKGHAVLAEVCKPEVYDAPAGVRRLLGHEILSILIDRASDQEVSDEWRGVILTIAGDPRVPNTSSRFRKWWSILGVDRQEKVRTWLSGFDLKLFLEVLNDYGISSGNTDLQRMFPARKTFLEGLLDQKLIQHARLFVGNSPECYLLRSYRKDELPEYAKVKDSYRSMIYLQVGHCHMIEGSHSFKLWLFPRLPTNAGITQYSKRRFDPKELSYDLERLYLDEFGKYVKAPIAVIHYPNLAWQAAAIKFLQGEGLSLNIEKLIEPGFYRDYKSKYGL
ncbi:MAG TPA: hypothetical protein ENG14_04010 [Thermodesulforhabdus norvegica]|uniref:Zorya protein ZorC EH domain-containing protein n=1 Tax=Thermodesulforhabdus norvegica TaxID=39841 RepID=A0A7C0WS53_9BACT|nr:hypothetical protein [Thermodesulforhabdus norvegica]